MGREGKGQEKGRDKEREGRIGREGTRDRGNKGRDKERGGK